MAPVFLVPFGPVVTGTRSSDHTKEVALDH